MTNITHPNVIDPAALITREPFVSIFPIDREHTLPTITASVRAEGVRDALLVMPENGGYVLIDGHTRREAATTARLKEVPVQVEQYPDDAAAILAALGRQGGRRNLEPGLMALRAVLAIKATGARAPAADKTAKLLGVAKVTVSRARVVAEDDARRDAVLKGEMTMTAAYNAIIAEREATKDAPEPGPDEGEPGEGEGEAASAPSAPRPRLVLPDDPTAAADHLIAVIAENDGADVLAIVVAMARVLADARGKRGKAAAVAVMAGLAGKLGAAEFALLTGQAIEDAGVQA